MLLKNLQQLQMNKLKSIFFVKNRTIFLADGINYVHIYIDDRKFKFLVDTGASISVIKSCCIRSFGNINQSKTVKINGISGSITSLGSINLELNFESENIFHEFIILGEIAADADGIIGGDFLRKYDAIVDYEKMCLAINLSGQRLITPLLNDAPRCNMIPPRCELIAFCKVSENITGDYVVLGNQLCDGIFLASTIVRPSSGVIPIKILNTRDDQVKLNDFNLELRSLNDFEVVNFGENSNLTQRVVKLMNEIPLSHLNSSEKDAITRICVKYADIFHLPGDKLTFTDLYKQKIHLQDNASPVYVKPYRLPHGQKEEINRQVKKMLEDDIIENASCEWSSPLLIVPKKSESGEQKKWRVVIDYRLLNKQIKDDKFPLPNITEILDALSGAIYFSHLDLTQGYYQLEITPESRPYTAFTTDRGQFQMKRLPMGLKISPSAFSRLMTVAMSGLTYERCFVYLDDLIIFGRNLDDHNKNLIKVFERLRKVNLKLNPAKCDFLRKEILYLGHVISEEGILPDPQKIEVVKNYPKPKDADETKRFVAFANYYRKFIKNFASLAAPLNNLTRKNAIFKWTEECENSFKILRNKLSNPPILQFPDFGEENEFILRTDASGIAIGATLSNGNDMPVAFASRSLNKAEKNYPTIEKELLSIVWAVKHFRPYLFGRKFKILTDHRPLVYLFSMRDPSSRLTKFRLILEDYNFIIEYVKGKCNATADALSRIEIHSNDLKDINAAMVMTRAQKKKQEEDDTEEEKVREIFDDSSGTDQPRVVELLKRPRSAIELIIDENLSVSKFPPKLQIFANKSESVIYVPKTKMLYVKLDSRSALAPDAVLRDLAHVCKIHNINEVIIHKATNENFIKILKKLLDDDFNWTGPRFCVVAKSQRICDENIKQLILNDYHLLPSSGHAGITRMYNNIKKRYFWTGLKSDIEKFIKKCDACQRNKYSIPVKQPMSITTTASSSFNKIFLDLVGPLPKDESGNIYILTLQCELSKFVEAYPLPNKESVTVAKALVNNFVLRYGIPEEIATDRGREFIAETMQEVCKLLKIKNITSTAYHHESIGALERSHKVLGEFLRIQTKNFRDSWTEWIPFWCFSYNVTVHSETKYQPFELVFGKQCILPSNFNGGTDPVYNFSNYPIELKFRMQRALEDARKNLIESKKKRKNKHDKNIRPITYTKGQLILVKNETGDKLGSLYRGPYVVLRDLDPNVEVKINNKECIIHKNRTKVYTN